MKITITFNQKEKETIINAMLGCASGVQKVVDKDEHLVGNFGEFKYDYVTNEIVCDLKPAFIKATAGLFASCVNIIKAFITTCEMFAQSWLSDVKDMTKEDECSEPNIKEEEKHKFFDKEEVLY